MKESQKVREYREKYSYVIDNRKGKEHLMPILKEIQIKERYIPKHAIIAISNALEVPLAHVYGVVTFYSFFTMVPKGEFPISICMGTACYVRGAEKVLEEFKKQLKVPIGETTEDGKFSISCLRCVGACGLAPVVTIGERTYGRVSAGDVADILKEYRN